ncbi:prepilin-type N-terminal cleavage/methylation domain-containing protein [Candidatus Gracilibacteria bacterium]|nr:prepilin-type N-terminal cleavage/methylation domain-containing protein [Candidatus Gracilibacteria bacterium]
MIRNKKAFTIIELLVGITIISLITIGITKLYTSDIPDKQKLDLFTNKIVGIFDTIKNYSLVGKGVGADLVTPNYYLIELSKSGSYLKTYYSTGGLNNTYYNQMSVNPLGEHYNIHSIKCNTLALNNSTLSINDDISIKYENGNITLSGCTNSYQKIVDIELYYKGFKKVLRLNSISGVLEQIRQ